MNQERLAEITAANADGKLWSAEIVAELLEYVAELKHNLRSAGECIDAYVASYSRSLDEIVRLKAERDAGVLDYLRTHPDYTRDLMRAEMGRLARRNNEPVDRRPT